MPISFSGPRGTGKTVWQNLCQAMNCPNQGESLVTGMLLCRSRTNGSLERMCHVEIDAATLTMGWMNPRLSWQIDLCLAWPLIRSISLTSLSTRRGHNALSRHWKNGARKCGLYLATTSAQDSSNYSFTGSTFWVQIHQGAFKYFKTYWHLSCFG